MSRYLKSSYHSSLLHQCASLSFDICPRVGYAQLAKGGIKCLTLVYEWVGLVSEFKLNMQDYCIIFLFRDDSKRREITKNHILGQFYG